MSTSTTGTPFSWPLYLLLHLLTILFLSLPSHYGPLRRLSFLPILLLGLTISPGSSPSHPSTGRRDLDFLLASGGISTLLLQASDYLLLTSDPQRTIRPTPRSPNSFKSRFAWATKLFTTPRCIGFSHQQVHALPSPPPPSISRAEFVARQVGRIGVCILVRDIVGAFIVSHPVFKAAGEGGGGVWVGELGWAGRALAGFATTAFMYPGFEMQYRALAAVMVGSGLSPPTKWPDMLGAWREAWSVRRFWGRTWHQMLRRCLTSHAESLTEALRIRVHTLSSRYIQLFTCFFLSGVIHYQGDCALLQDSCHPLSFFMLQAVVIMFEDAILYLAERLGIGAGKEGDGKRRKWKWRWVGYVWTFGWFAWCLPWWLGPRWEGGELDGVEFLELGVGRWLGGMMGRIYPGRLLSVPVVGGY
ncbi:hypothetical protein AMATHDRAFT_155534 [Amanita thiersii Skay4041]|uniref:Wax synthase domain-containing protein n=1 Tax=Amanita thiersii Skay4041 TaxID=703135 RepID=A0A2A9NF59_9AGAR|nr:hypothetical protein AMATHDRAFT_155534 [Amanita thiersii Skay4041]